MDGAEARFKAEGRRDVAIAHTTAMFSRAKKLEALSFYLPAAVKRRVGSMLERLRAIAERTKDL